MKAIETAHDGYLFRSKTEARWSKFFCEANIEYEFEKQGFDLDGLAYLPDFWLTKPHWWVEIKGEHPTEEEKDKAKRLAAQSGCDTYIFVGQPASVAYGSFPAYSFPAIGSPQENIRGQLVLSHLADLLAYIACGICVRPDNEQQAQDTRLKSWRLMAWFDHALDEARQHRFDRGGS